MKSWDRLFIGGRWAAPASSDTIEVISPHTEQVVATVPGAARPDVDAAVAAARSAVDDSGWPTRPLEERLEVVARFGEEYQRRLAELAEVATREMGGPITTSTFMTQAAAATVPVFTSIARSMSWTDDRPGAYGGTVRVTHTPIGVVAAVVPWNAPQFLTMAKLVPALVTGCAVVVKPAPETPVDGLILGEIAEAAGLPHGLLSVLPADREVSEYLVGHPGVDKIAFTGSTAAGRRIGALAGGGLKRVNLELGGKSATVVLDDADMAAVVDGVRSLTLSNSGQVCSAQTRVIVARSRYSEAVEALAGLADAMVLGDPMDPTVEVGPLVAERQRDRVRGYIELGGREGSRLVTGGASAPEGHERGWYVRPTVFADVDNASRLAQEEIFGPVLTVTPAADDDEAVRLANDSEYGLSGSVWTQDLERGFAVAGRIQTGNVGVNRSTTLDPAAPFGGAKASGVGTELGPEGLTQYSRYKSYYYAG